MFPRAQRTRAHVAAVGVVTAVALALTGCGDQPDAGPTAQDSQTHREEPSPRSTDSRPAPTSPTTVDVPSFVVTGGQVEGPAQVTASVGEEVVFTVTADTADEVHVHGYDLTVPAEPGRPATVRFQADVPGIFEVELEASHLPLTQLRVTQ